MFDELVEFDAHPEWRVLLDAYAGRLSPAEPVCERLSVVEGLPTASLSALHGKLVAHGFLKFEWDGPRETLVYEMTPAGRHALLSPSERNRLKDLLSTANEAPGESTPSTEPVRKRRPFGHSATFQASHLASDTARVAVAECDSSSSSSGDATSSLPEEDATAALRDEVATDREELLAVGAGSGCDGSTP